MGETLLESANTGRRVWTTHRGATVLLLCAAILAAWRYTTTAPRFPMPPPPLPQTNAFYVYVQAARQMEHIPHRERLCDPRASPDTLAEVVFATQPALAEVRRALNQPYALPLPHPTEGWATDHLASFAELACALIAGARVAAAEGNLARAVHDALDALRLGSDTARGGNLPHARAGWQIESNALEMLTAIGRQLPADQCRALASSLLALEQEHESLAAIRRRAFDQARHLLWRLAQGDPETRRTLRRRMDYAWLSVGDLLLRGPWNLRGAAWEMERLFRLAITNANRPAGKRDPLPWPRYSVSRVLCASLYEDLRIHDVLLARWRLLAVALALQAYHEEHGDAPSTLEDLVPSYLPRIPQDPFGQGESLHYRREPVPMAYCIGSDGEDNHGARLPGKGLVSRLPGDIVITLGTPYRVRSCPIHAGLRAQQERRGLHFGPSPTDVDRW